MAQELLPPLIQLMPDDFVTTLTKAAEDFFGSHEHDAAHDLEHHRKVWGNCQRIVEGENLEDKINPQVLQVAALSHDIHRDSLDDNKSFLLALASQTDTPEGFIEEVLEVIEVHSFGNDQERLEAQVLYDADKIEYVNLERLKGALKAVESGKMTSEVLQKHLETWAERVPFVRDSMHFEASKKLFDERFKQAADWCKGKKGLNDVYSMWYNLYHAPQN